MSECTSGELRDLLPELLNDELDAETRARVEAHVASCTECADELALLRALRPALARGPAIDVDRIAAGVRAGIARGSMPERSTVAPRWKVAIAAAALVAVSAIGYVAATHRGQDRRDVAQRSAPGATHRDTAQGAPSRADSMHGSPVTPPRTEHVPAASQQVAAALPRTRSTSHAAVTLASTGVLDNVSDLSDEDVRALTASLDTLSSVPDANPSPGIDPLGASLDDLGTGGR